MPQGSDENPRAARKAARAERAYLKAQRPWIFRHKFVSGGIAILALIVIVTALSSGSGKAPLTGAKAVGGSRGSSASASVVSVGQPLTITESEGVKATVTVRSVTDHHAGTGALAQPPQNGEYVVANVTISDLSGQYDFNPLYFKYLVNGNAYDISAGNAATAGFDPSLDAGTLNPGQSTGGNVVFDVPQGRAEIQITDQLGTVLGGWRVQ